MDDHTPISRQELDIRRISATNGERLPVRPEYAAPLSVGDIVQSKRERGMVKLAREQYDAVLADHKRSIDEGWASPAIEIAAQLREEVRDLETIHSGTFMERLEAIAAETDDSDDWTTGYANLLVKMALHVMRAP